MTDPRERAARETLRRLGDLLADVPPSDEEARELVSATDAELDAIAAGIHALADAHEASVPGLVPAARPPARTEPPPPATLRDPPAEEAARRAVPFLGRTPNGRLAVAAGVLAALAAGAAALLMHPAALPERGIGEETAGVLSAIEQPPPPDAGVTPSQTKPPP